MNILAIDTSTNTLSVSVHSAGKTWTLEAEGLGQHAEHLSSVISEILQLSGLTEKELELIACPHGPGSFTGLRLSWSAAKALQLAAECSLIAVSPLACYARIGEHWPGVVISVLDAKRQRFYTQFFRRGRAVTEALDLQAQEAKQYLDPEERILVTGPDALLFSEQLQACFPEVDISCLPSRSAGISADLIFFAKSPDSCYTKLIADHEGPLYVRKSDAEEHEPKQF